MYSSWFLWEMCVISRQHINKKFMIYTYWIRFLIIFHFQCHYSYCKGTSIRQAPVFRHLRVLLESPWKFIIWMNEFYYTACCWFPTSSNILILQSQFWQIRFVSYWLHCSKCRILVLLRYKLSKSHKGFRKLYDCSQTLTNQ